MTASWSNSRAITLRLVVACWHRYYDANSAQVEDFSNDYDVDFMLASKSFGCNAQVLGALRFQLIVVGQVPIYLPKCPPNDHCLHVL